MARTISIILALFCGLSLLYSNCGRVGEGGLVTSLAKVESQGPPVQLTVDQLQCELARKDAYRRTFYSFFRSTCVSCHVHDQAHANPDIDVSFNAFQTTGQEKIEYQATHPHGGNNFGSANQNTINNFRPQWDAAVNEYVTCMSASGNLPVQTTAPQETKLTFRTASVGITDLEKTKTNRSMWVLAQMDLADTIPDKYKNTVNGTLTMEVQYWLSVVGNPIGVIIRNPIIQLVSTDRPIKIKGFRIYANDVLVPTVTSYQNLNARVEPGQPLQLSTAPEAVGVAGMNSNLTLSAELVDVDLDPDSLNAVNGNSQTTTSNTTNTQTTSTTTTTSTSTSTNNTVVTFQDLVSGAPTLQVFGQNCITCHKTGAASGGLDLTNYSSAKNRSSLILSRMSSASSPMPPSGKLSATQIEKVQSWISSGTPEK